MSLNVAPWSCPVNLSSIHRPPPGKRTIVRSSAAALSAQNDGVGAEVEVKKRKLPEVEVAKGSQEGARPERLEMLYDDGYGGVSVLDYFNVAKQLIRPDDGPPRWFCPVECGRPIIADAPVMLFLPGLILHHKSLGSVFEVRRMHIPTHDRFLFEGTSFVSSQLQSVLPLLEILPDDLHTTIPHLLSLVMGMSKIYDRLEYELCC